MKGSSGLLRLLLAFFCVANVIFGIVALIGGDLTVSAANVFYGARIELDPQLTHVVRILGAFVFVLGILGGIAAANPAKNRVVINGIILLLAIRVIQRIILANEISSTFGISNLRNWANIAFFLAIAVALFFLRPKADSV